MRDILQSIMLRRNHHNQRRQHQQQQNEPSILRVMVARRGLRLNNVVLIAICSLCLVFVAHRMMLQVKVELPFSFKEPSTTTTLSSSFGVSARNVSQPHLYMRQQLLEKASRTTTRTTFFYNIFIPDSQDGQENSLRIVQEQLQQLADSDAVTHSLDQGSTWVLYITIGAENVLTSSWLETNQACPPSLVCKHAGHYRAGTEALTMQLLHDFCRLTDNQHAETTKLVTYIHNKGSFHYSEINENWRYHLTRGATYEDCITHLQKDDCNVCGLRFFPIWTPIFPGNMWTATCPYVASLLSVDDHERSLRKVVSKALLMRLRGHISMNAFKDQQDYLGLARWSKEHWIGSHPNIRACDVNPANKYKEKRGRDQVEFQWSNKPRESAWDAQWLDDDKRVLLQSDEYLQLKEFYFLPGNLMKWFTMYTHAPPDNSNLWKVLPKGAFWKDRVKEFGEKAVEQVLSNPSQWFAKVSPQEVVPKLFTDDRNRRFDALATNAKHGVFYDVYVPEDSGEIHEQALVSQLRIMDDSLGGYRSYNLRDIDGIGANQCQSMHKSKQPRLSSADTLARALCRRSTAGAPWFLPSQSNRQSFLH